MGAYSEPSDGSSAKLVQVAPPPCSAPFFQVSAPGSEPTGIELNVQTARPEFASKA